MFTVKTFADGQLPDTATDLCTPGAGEAYYVKNVILSNVSASSIDVTLWKTIGANYRQILKATLAVGESISGTGYVLATGESIRGLASVAASVDYVIDGVEQS